VVEIGRFSTYLTGKRVFLFGDATHVKTAARIARDEMGFEVVGLGCYNREFARSIRALAKEFGVEPLITDDYLEVEKAIEDAAPEMILGTQMERHIGKRLGIPCAVISAPVHVQDFPARYSPQMGWEGANVIFDTWIHPLVMGLEEHLLAMFREDFEFHDAAGPSHHGGHAPKPVRGDGDAGPGGRGRSRRAYFGKDEGRMGSAPAETGSDVMVWLADAERELKKIPFFVRGKAKRNTEKPTPPSAVLARSASTPFTKRRPILRGDGDHIPGYRVVIVTLDSHAAGPAARVSERLSGEFPGLKRFGPCRRRMGREPGRAGEARSAVRHGDIVIANLLFIEEHITAILPDLQARRDGCDAMIGVISAREVVQLTRMGELDMMKPATGPMKLLKKLRGSKEPSANSGEKQMKLLRRLPKILKFIPGKAQDLRAWFLTMQYWLGGSDDNVEQMVRFLVGTYAHDAAFKGAKAEAPIDYPEVGLYHPDLPGHRIVTDFADLPNPENPVATVGLLMMRSYVLASDTGALRRGHPQDAGAGLAVIPAFAGGLDGRPAISTYFEGGRIDAMVSLTGFSLIGGPAYNDSAAAVEVLKGLDVPYIAAHPIEFQTLGQWASSEGGLGPVETTMLVALPEIDGATNPTVFGGRHSPEGCNGCSYNCPRSSDSKAMAPCLERIDSLVEKTRRLAVLRRKANAEKKVGIVLFGFPPNAGAIGTAAYLSVFESLFNTLQRMKAEGYDVEVPATVDDLRNAVLHGNAKQYGQEANVAAHVDADTIVRSTPPLKVIESVWGPAPGKIQSDGRGVFVLGQHFGNVFVGVQPTFGYEGDPMRLLFEKGFAPTHAFTQFYMWLKNTYQADVLLHFGMHGALEFMPGKQAGLGARDWPDRLIGELPNVYLYASNNPSEATLAKRRSNAVTITHLTPPLAASGLYKGLAESEGFPDALAWARPRRGERTDLAALIEAQADAVDLDERDPDKLWLTLLETEDALIPDGLHVVGRPIGEAELQEHLRVMAETDAETRARIEHLLRQQTELTGLMRALSARYIEPVPGGDLIRSPEVLPTGRNIHAFDPFRMPTAFALQDGAKQADRLIEAAGDMPRSVALVLWGSDNIKSDGGPISQALALMGAKPRFDGYGRSAART
jgi:magnesium chelatase subunit H